MYFGDYIGTQGSRVRSPGNDGNNTWNQIINGADGGSGNANDPLDAPAYLVLNSIIKA
jgi:hypothetical protein